MWLRWQILLAVCIGLCTVAAAPEAFGSLFVWCILFKYWKTLCRWYLLLLYYCSGLFILHFLYKAIAGTCDALFRPEQPSCPLYKPPVFLPHAPVAECNDGTETPELFLGAQRALSLQMCHGCRALCQFAVVGLV